MTCFNFRARCETKQQLYSTLQTFIGHDLLVDFLNVSIIIEHAFVLNNKVVLLFQLNDN